MSEGSESVIGFFGGQSDRWAKLYESSAGFAQRLHLFIQALREELPAGGRILDFGCGPGTMAVDLVCTRLMGFDYRKIPVLANAMRAHRYPLKVVEHEQLRCSSNDPRYRRRLAEFEGPCLGLRPHFGWTGHVELVTDGEVAASI